MYLKSWPSGEAGRMRWECEEISDLEEMPTSIVRIYTSQGFVIAADGREYDPKSGNPLSNNIRKVFPIKEPKRALLYALSALVPSGDTNS